MVKAVLREKEGDPRKALLLSRIVMRLAMMTVKERVKSLWLRSVEWWTGALGWSLLLSVKAS